MNWVAAWAVLVLTPPSAALSLSMQIPQVSGMLSFVLWTNGVAYPTTRVIAWMPDAEVIIRLCKPYIPQMSFRGFYLHLSRSRWKGALGL